MKYTEQRRTIAVDLLHVVADEYERKVAQRDYYIRIARDHGLSVGQIVEAVRTNRAEVERILESASE